MSQISFHFECHCVLDGVGIECSGGYIRAINVDGSQVMEHPLVGDLVSALRRIDERTFPSDAHRVELAVRAMRTAGAQWVTVKSEAWWLSAFAEAIALHPEEFEGAMATTASFSSAFDAYAQSIDYMATRLNSYPGAKALERLRLEQCPQG